MRRLIDNALLRDAAKRLSREVVHARPVDTRIMRYLPLTGSIAEAARLQEHIEKQIRDMFLIPSHLLGEKSMRRTVHVYEQKDGSLRNELVPPLPHCTIINVHTDLERTSGNRISQLTHTITLEYKAPTGVSALGSFTADEDDGEDECFTTSEEVFDVEATFKIEVDEVIYHAPLEIDLRVQSHVDDCHTYHFTAEKGMQNFRAVSDSNSGTVYTLSPGGWSEALCRRIMELESEIEELWAK